jgi:FtsZ-interacting cell division protein YlmF
MSSYHPENHEYYGSRTDTAEAPIFRHYASEEASTAEIVIIEPLSFNDVPEAIQALRNQQMVVLNLAQMNFEEAQRSIDFLAGGILMFNGTVEKIDQKIFLFAPYNTEIITDGHQERQHNNASSTQNSSFPKRINNAFWNANAIHQVS